MHPNHRKSTDGLAGLQSAVEEELQQFLPFAQFGPAVVVTLSQKPLGSAQKTFCKSIWATHSRV